jgi:hypothetical protein
MKDKANYDGHNRKAGHAKRKRQARNRRNRRNNRRATANPVLRGVVECERDGCST